MADDHPFAQYVRILGRGPSLSRSLTREEARAAMAMVLDGRAEPMQVGALLLLLRYRGESAEELAGFAEAARDAVSGPAPAGAADLDWPSYADRHRQQPYFVLAALLLAEAGVRVLMHGIAGYADGYAPTRPVLDALGLPQCRTVDQVAERLAQDNFAYLGLERACPPLERLFDLRPLLGVRTVVNSFARALNPLDAPAQIQGITHPPYRPLQQQAAALLGVPRTAVFKGGGGEAQRNPQKACRVAWVRDGELGDAEWPACAGGAPYPWRDDPLAPAHLVALWRGELDLPVPEAAVVATAALGLWLAGRAPSPEAADRDAAELWAARPREKYGRAAALSA